MATVAEALTSAWRLHQQGQFQEAERLYRQVVQAAPSHADAWCLLGAVCQAQGRLSEAEADFQRAAALMPAHPSATNFLGALLAQQGRLDEAAAAFEQSLRFQPHDAEAWNNLGLVRAQQQRLDEAADHYRKAIRLQPGWPDGHYNLGNALYLLGHVDEAIAHYREALRLRPDYAEAQSNLADALRLQGNLPEAVAHFEKAIALRPDLPEAHANLALAYQVEGHVEKARDHFQQSLHLRPSKRIQAQMATLLLPIYQSVSEVTDWRQRLESQVSRLHAENFRLDLTGETALPPFYLAYQGFNDCHLARQIAQLYHAPSEVLCPRRQSKINLAFVSSYFTEHTVGHWMRGLVAELSREAFTVSVLSFGRHVNEIADFYRKHADHYLLLPNHLPSARKMIADLQLDVLFYTDIGMEPLTYTLAFTRLAPVQCVTVGHPVTTGIETIDYFISSRQLEGDQAQGHYTEKLVQLETLPTCYYRPQIAGQPRTRGHFGLGEDDHVYVCPQSLFKFHPDFDAILGGILRSDPRGKLVLSGGTGGNALELLRQRFARTLADVMSRIQFVPMLSHSDFLNLLALSDVQLDTLHFGGGRTSYDGFAMGTPIVTLPTEFLRGRITLSLYKQMGFFDCVAKDQGDYVSIALTLGRAAEFRNAISRQIVAAREVLFHSTAGFAELDHFLRDIA